jgi:hypothetical protein
VSIYLPIVVIIALLSTYGIYIIKKRQRYKTNKEQQKLQEKYHTNINIPENIEKGKQQKLISKNTLRF